MFITARNPLSDRHLSDTMFGQQYINMNLPFNPQSSFKSLSLSRICSSVRWRRTKNWTLNIKNLLPPPQKKERERERESWMVFHPWLVWKKGHIYLLLHLGPGSIKIFTAVMYHNKLECLPLPFTFHSSLIFVGKADSLQLQWSPVRGSSLVGSGVACKY